MSNPRSPEEVVVSSPKLEMKETQHALPSLHSLDELMQHMTLRRWMPASPWDWPWWQGFRKAMESSRIPAVDVLDFDEEIKVRVEVPGVEKQDLKVSFTDDCLTIQGSVTTAHQSNDGRVRRCEICAGEFERSIPLSGGIDHEKVRASLRDGLLEITLPKSNGSRRHSVSLS